MPFNVAPSDVERGCCEGVAEDNDDVGIDCPLVRHSHDDWRNRLYHVAGLQFPDWFWQWYGGSSL